MRKTANQRGYNYRWQIERVHFLNRNPLCKYCQREGVIEAATVVDHIIPHKGDQALFWDSNNWQALCDWHHNSVKQREEGRGRPITPVGLDGWRITT